MKGSCFLISCWTIAAISGETKISSFISSTTTGTTTSGISVLVTSVLTISMILISDSTLFGYSIDYWVFSCEMKSPSIGVI